MDEEEPTTNDAEETGVDLSAHTLIERMIEESNIRGNHGRSLNEYRTLMAQQALTAGNLAEDLGARLPVEPRDTRRVEMYLGRRHVPPSFNDANIITPRTMRLSEQIWADTQYSSEAESERGIYNHQSTMDRVRKDASESRYKRDAYLAEKYKNIPLDETLTITVRINKHDHLHEVQDTVYSAIAHILRARYVGVGERAGKIVGVHEDEDTTPVTIDVNRTTYVGAISIKAKDNLSEKLNLVSKNKRVIKID